MIRPLALSLILGSTLSSAASAVSQTELVERIEASKQLYFDGQHQDSLDQLESMSAELTEDALRSDAFLFIGMNHLALGNATSATEAFQSSIRANPDLVPQEEVFPADAIAAFVETRNALVGRIDVRTSPPGANATVGGRSVGTTPYSGNALAGDHVVRVELEDYHRYESQVTVEPNETAQVQVTMRMTPEALRRAQEAADRAAGGGPRGTRKMAYIMLGGAAAGGAVVALQATGSSREDGALVTRTFNNTAPPFVPAGPFIADVGSMPGTLQVDLTWDNPQANLFAEVRLVRGAFETVHEQAPTGEGEMRFTFPVRADNIYHVVFRNFSQVPTTFTLVMTFPG